MSLLNIGMSGLSASSSSLATTGNNIANVDTAGYSRQQTVQSTKSSQQFGNVFIGTGTTLADVRRVYNSYLENQLHTATSVILDQAKGARDSLSQVNLDEETGNLVKYQQYYTASSQIIKAAQETFATLINSL